MLGALGLAASGASVSATASCGTRTGGAAASPTPEAPDPEQALLAEVIAGKERLVTLYQQAALTRPTLAAQLSPFAQRQQAHLAALRRHLAKPLASSSPVPVATPVTPVTVAMLRGAERAAAASRRGQLATASPVLSQLLASIGACEALHTLALGKIK
jgi:hypothetical protein